MIDRTTLDADVIILGSGLAGSTVALCLVRQGLRVMIIDQGTHPRFALGESTTTPSSLWLRLLAERYNAPELLDIATAHALKTRVAPTSGVKNNFGFIYHQKAAEKPACAWQAVLPHASLFESESDQEPTHTEMHYFRQDVDAHLWAAAIAAGAIGRPRTEVVDIAFDEDCATLDTAGGEKLRSAFVVDASGYRSVIAARLNLRDEPPKMRSNTRTMFTHMIGVEPFENLNSIDRSMSPWSHGTLHHIFDGGWMWVIPFGNHRASVNRLCSVGLSVDNRRFPRDSSQTPETEWRQFLADYPSIGRQFSDAAPVRAWISTDRLQYTSKCCAGDRFWMTAHAAGAVDGLYSFGNINTFQTIATGVSLILDSFKEDRFTQRRFAPLQRLTDNLLRFQDRIVFGNYASFRDPRLLQAWITLWALTDTARIRQVLIPLVKYVRTRDRSHLDVCIQQPEEILTGFGQCTGLENTDIILGLLDAWCDIMQDLDEDRVGIDETCQRLEAALQSDPRFGIDLPTMGKILGELPWRYSALADNSLRCYSNAFLTDPEMDNLGID
jgi:tetracycline 7-halogenase / FADH2 O2-dependent halogenase